MPSPLADASVGGRTSPDVMSWKGHVRKRLAIPALNAQQSDICLPATSTIHKQMSLSSNFPAPFAISASFVLASTRTPSKMFLLCVMTFLSQLASLSLWPQLTATVCLLRQLRIREFVAGSSRFVVSSILLTAFAVLPSLSLVLASAVWLLMDRVQRICVSVCGPRYLHACLLACSLCARSGYQYVRCALCTPAVKFKSRTHPSGQCCLQVHTAIGLRQEAHSLRLQLSAMIEDKLQLERQLAEKQNLLDDQHSSSATAQLDLARQRNVAWGSYGLKALELASANKQCMRLKLDYNTVLAQLDLKKTECLALTELIKEYKIRMPGSEGRVGHAAHKHEKSCLQRMASSG